ncbi:uncharacterized protein LOC135390952 [Ornithodoros turicata]|uniref:uncharacterized protein LOC135390952 n=1 Tax=Ornithodoros turicata TaxID=34597 RepID=UPI0031396A87
MHKLISSRSSTTRVKQKDAHQRERKKSTAPKARHSGLVDVVTLLEFGQDLPGLSQCPVLLFSTKFSSSRQSAFWNLALKKGYFVEKTERRKTILRPVLRLYSGVTDVTSDAIAGNYEQVQPLTFVRSRRELEPFCKFARHSWLESKLPKHQRTYFGLIGIMGVTFPRHSLSSDHLNYMLHEAMQLFINTSNVVGFPVLYDLNQHCKNVGTFLKKMHELRAKCQLCVEVCEPGILPVCRRRLPKRAFDEDDLDNSNTTIRSLELHASKEVHVCLLYRFAMITHSILQYLILINVGGKVVQAFAEEVMIVGVKQQITETVLEMYLEPSTRIIESLFDAVMSRVATFMLKSGSTTKHIRIKTVEQCRIGAAVGAWQFVTFLLAAVSESFAKAAITEVGREERNRKYLQDSLGFMQRIKDDCLYCVFRLLSLKHRKLGLLKAQHQAQDPLNVVGMQTVTLLSKVIVAYALHMFKTKRSNARHLYIYEEDVREDFGRFLAELKGFSVAVPQPPITVNDLTGGRLQKFMVEMSVIYYKEVVDVREHLEASKTGEDDVVK